MLKLKRVYEPSSPQDGFRVLVERLWPRGITKEQAAVDLWLKEIAPSTELRKWFGHDPAKWPEFRDRYRQELGKAEEALNLLRQRMAHGAVTLVFASRDEQHNSALVLKEHMASSLKKQSRITS